MLSVTGTIVTYELVLIQFHQNDAVTDSDPCNVTHVNNSLSMKSGIVEILNWVNLWKNMAVMLRIHF